MVFGSLVFLDLGSIYLLEGKFILLYLQPDMIFVFVTVVLVWLQCFFPCMVHVKSGNKFCDNWSEIVG